MAKRVAKRKRAKRGGAPSLFTLFIALLILIASLVKESSPLPHDGSVELYCNQSGDDLRATFQKAIESAKSSIVLAVYSLSDAKIANSLRESAERGVDITVVVDHKASPHIKRVVGKKIRAISRAPKGLMHLKILVVDSQKVLLGSANLTYESLRSHGNLVVGIDNPHLATSLHDYLRAMPKTGPPRQIENPLPFSQLDQEGKIWFLPEKAALQSLIQIISQATDSLKVAMFTWTHPAITQAIIDASHRGVKVSCVIDRNQGLATGSTIVSGLRINKVPTYLSQGKPLLHYKMLIVDDTTLIIGSANWTKSAFTRNDDCFLILSPLSLEQKKFLEKAWSVILHESERSLLSY